MAGYWVLLRAYLCLRRAFLARSASRTACDLLVLSEACSLVDSSSAATQRSRQLGRQYSDSYINRAHEAASASQAQGDIVPVASDT